MKKIINFLYSYYLKNAFWVNTLTFLIIFCRIPINDINPAESRDFFESIRLSQLGSILLIASLFYYKLVRPAGSSHAFYTTDKFYCDLMFITVILGITFTIHYINWETTDVHSAIKVWEIAAYAVTLLYTFWLWIFSLRENMKKIIEEKNITCLNKLGFVFFIIVALLILLAITIGHIIITFSSDASFIKTFSIQFSILLIFFTYFLFDLISAKVIEFTNEAINIDEVIKKEKLLDPGLNETNRRENLTSLNKIIKDYNEEFKFGLKYMDRPMKWVFVIMTVYAVYSTGIDFFAKKHVMHEMESFFGGAIAFELLLSSVVWAKTKI